MPPRKRAKHSTSAAPPSRRSERSTQGVGGHAAQLKKTGETLAAPTRKGRVEPTIEMSGSDAEENPMAPSQLRKTKKNHSVTANNQVRPGSQPSRTSQPTLHTTQVLERFGFKPPTSSTRKTGATHTKAHQVADQDIAEDRDSECDGDSDLQPEHNRDFDLQHNNQDEYDSASENGNQGPDDNPREDEDSQMDQNQSTGQQRNQVDGFDDDLEGGMHDFDQGINDELNDAARQKSQEGV
ncbi:hypothetical protein EV424DRAFT_1345370 [Suillus variegatus]|nr:hypothetical protein EV424DRAFT_1345370 [Suillus variegatus]